MNEYLINLTNYKNGVTLTVDYGFKGEVAPFLIFITDESGKIMYYYRTINKGMVSINLPVHSDRVILNSEKYKPKSVLISSIRIYKMNYEFNKPLIVKRPYSIDKIQEQYLPYIPDQDRIVNGRLLQNQPTEQPARFLPSHGIIQYSNMVFNRIPQPTIEFIKRHEKGHYYYGRPLPPANTWQFYPIEDQRKMQQIMLEDEQEADRYALYSMVNDGYNFSGALQSTTDFLTHSYISKERMQKLSDIIEQEHKKNLYEWN